MTVLSVHLSSSEHDLYIPRTSPLGTNTRTWQSRQSPTLRPNSPGLQRGVSVLPPGARCLRIQGLWADLHRQGLGVRDRSSGESEHF